MPLITQPQPPAAGALLAELHSISSRHGYLPEDELREAARRVGVPLVQVYSVATFYASFSFKPRGRHSIHVCMGTACYIRGSETLLEKLKAKLDLDPGETTGDRAYSLDMVRCVGSCSTAPVVRIDGDTYGRLKPDGLMRILKKYEPAEDGAAADEHSTAGNERDENTQPIRS